MILDAHASLEAFLRAHALGASGVAVAFDVPSKAWASARKAPTVSCFLYDVRENQLVKHAGTQPVRDASGRVVASRPVPRYLDHCYLVSAWTGDVGREHRLLSAVLGALLVHDTLPREVLRGALAQQPRHVVLSVAQGSKRGMLLQLAGEQRLALELELAVPWSGGPDEVVESHVEQLPRIVVAQREPGEPRLRRRAAAAVPTPAVPAVPAPAAGPAAAAAAPAGAAPAVLAPAAVPAEGPPAVAAPDAPADPQQVAAQLMASVAVRLLGQLVGAATPDSASPSPQLAPRAAAQIGAQVGARVAALLEAGPGEAVRRPEAPPSALQHSAARLGAGAGTQLLARLRTAVDDAGAEGGPARPTAQAAARLGAQVGAALAAAVVAAAGGARPPAHPGSAPPPGAAAAAPPPGAAAAAPPPGAATAAPPPADAT